MIPTPLALDKRLQHRYRELVQQHLGQAKATATGLRTLPAASTAFAAVQAAWRFWRNPEVTLPRLAQPLLDCAHAAVTDDCQRYALVVHDWSHLNYASHTSKRDCRAGATAGEIGYDAYVALVVADTAGQPLAPIQLSLHAADGLHDSRHATLQSPPSKLDGLESVFDFVRQQAWSRPAVHIIDREADSVTHYRAWQREGHLFLVRADADRLVLYGRREQALEAVVARLQERGAFAYSREVEYHGRPARQEVAEATVVLHRDGFQTRVEAGAKKKRRVPGAALTLRLVVSRVYSPAGQLQAEWLLLSNAPGEVTAAELALWYYWRWRIESYFKLVKSAGLELEHWQQETAEALARRLLVASMACALVWQVARDGTPAGGELRRLLVRLSGRQMGWGVEYTEPALLAGLWVLLAMQQTLEEYSPAELRRLAQLALGGGRKENSG